MAYTQLIDRYWEALYRHIFIKIKHEDDAKDIVQDIFLGLWKNRKTISTDDKDSLAPYIFMAAKYAIINRFSRPGISISEAPELLKAINISSGVKTDEGIMVGELRDFLDKEINSLPERLQTPYRLSREQELSVREIAMRLSISEQTVKNNITSALNIIRYKLGKYNSEAALSLIIAISANLHH